MRERPLSASFDPDTATLRFSGAVDESQVALFESHLIKASSLDVDFVSIDLSDVDYFPSAAVGALVRGLAPGAAESRYELVAAAGSITQRVLYLSGIPHRQS